MRSRYADESLFEILQLHAVRGRRWWISRPRHGVEVLAQVLFLVYVSFDRFVLLGRRARQIMDEEMTMPSYKMDAAERHHPSAELPQLSSKMAISCFYRQNSRKFGGLANVYDASQSRYGAITRISRPRWPLTTYRCLFCTTYGACLWELGYLIFGTFSGPARFALRHPDGLGHSGLRRNERSPAQLATLQPRRMVGWLHRFECSLKQVVAAGLVRRNQEENFIPFSGAGNNSVILPKSVLCEHPLARLFCLFHISRSGVNVR
jgi:hypothetical protein